MKQLKTLLFIGFYIIQSNVFAQYAVDTLKNYSLVEFVVTGTRTDRSVALCHHLFRL